MFSPATPSTGPETAAAAGDWRQPPPPAIIEYMFEGWPCDMEPPTRMLVDPPLPILVDLSLVLSNPDDRFRRDTVPLRVKCEGLQTNEKDVPGVLHAWAQSVSAGWLANISCTVHTGNHKGHLEIRQWCPAKAIKPAPRPTAQPCPSHGESHIVPDSKP